MPLRAYVLVGVVVAVAAGTLPTKHGAFYLDRGVSVVPPDSKTSFYGS
jgi:hypothetical protein